MESLEVIKHKDKIIRNYILGRNWDKNNEFLIAQQIIKGKKIKNYLKKFPYVYDYEWEVVHGHNNYGKGDLVFTDGKGNFLIVECKYIDLSDTGSTARTKRRKKRRYIEEQITRYIDAFKRKNRETKKVSGLGVTNEEVLKF